MKKILLIITSIFSVFLFADDSIIGVWKIDDKTHNNVVLVKFEEEDGKIVGHIVDMKRKFEEDGSIIIDDKNPDPVYRGKPLLGALIVKNFVYNQKEESLYKYINGKVYDPTSGKWYYAKAYVKDDKLYLKGSLDKMGLLGLTQIWTKYDSDRLQ